MLAGSRRAEFYWEGPAGTGAALATAIRGWEHLRFEVSEDPTPRSDGGRWLHTPGLGIHYAQTDTAGNVVVGEDRIRYAMETRGGRSRSSCTANCRSRSAPPGTKSSSRSGTRATTPRSSGCTRSAETTRSRASQTQAVRGATNGSRRPRIPDAENAYRRLTRQTPRGWLRAGASSSCSRTGQTERERDDGVVAAEAERVADRELRTVAERLRRAGDAATGSRGPASVRLIVGGADAVAQRQDREDRLERTGAAEEVTGRCLGGRHRDLVRRGRRRRCRSALYSAMSPDGVEVACALMCVTSSADAPACFERHARRRAPRPGPRGRGR